MAEASRDQNHVTSALGVSSSDASVTLAFQIDPLTGRLLTDCTGGGNGDVVGPASATDNAIARFDTTTGKLIQNSAVTIADTTGNMAGVGTINTLVLPASNFVGLTDSQILTGKTINGANNTLTVRLANDVTGNLPVTNLNSGTSASNTTFWRGDGVWATPAGGGTVTAVSVASANGFAGSSSGGATPELTLTTTVTGILKGNATAISAATAGTDYVVGSTGLAGGQTIAGGTLTTQNLSLRPNAADLTTGAVAHLGMLEATNTTTGSVTVAGGLAVAKRVYALDMTVTNTITGTTSGNLVSGGALGTPSSGTLTNCTGLPIAGLVSSTSTALGVGSIELGAASDTTLARVSAGVVSIEGVNILTTSTGLALAGGTMTGNLVMGTGTDIKLTVPTGDGTATGIITNEFNSGYSSTAIGDLVYLDSSATWQKADADLSAAAYSSMLGIALEVKASGAACAVLLQGFVYAATPFPTLTIGAPIYMSATAGVVTQTAPATTDSATRIVGYAVHADKMYFNPSNDWITHT